MPCGCFINHQNGKIVYCHTHAAAQDMRSALEKIGAIIESPCDPLSMLRKIGRIQVATFAQISGQDQQPKPEVVTFCPYCGSSDTEKATGAFLEIGKWQGNSHESEGGAEGCRCKDCLGEFWINGPEIPQEKQANSPDVDAA